MIYRSDDLPQNVPISSLTQVQEWFEKANPRHNLTTKEIRRLAKLEAIAGKLKRRENVQNRQLQTWLWEDKCEQFEYE